MPRIIHGAVLPELRNTILTGMPKRTVLVHVPYNDAIILARIRVGRIEVFVRDCCPAHTAFPGTVDDTPVNLAEAGLDVVVESRADVNTGRPHLNMTDDIVRVVRCANVGADEAVGLEALT